MARRQLTNNADETDIAGLLSGDTVFAIPYFQRAYKWKPERLQQLNRDLLSLVDQSNDYHFLGAIIIHGRRSNPSDPDVYDVIDGQQRITTLYIYLCAIVKTLAAKGECDEAAGLFLKYLVITRDTNLVSNVKLHSCKDDRSQLNAVIKDLMSNKAFARAVSVFKFKPLPDTDHPRGRLVNNYRAALRFFGEQAEREGLDRVRALYKALLESMSVVQIDVRDPTNGPKIFDSLNSRQEPMTTGDLVRNEIFSRVADKHPDTIEQIDQHSWQPFYNKFKDGEQSWFDAYFFPYGLIRDANLRKSDVYARLRDEWRDIEDPEIIISRLGEYQNAFLDLVKGSNLQEHPKAIAEAFRRLHDAGIPSSTYPFFMRLSNAIKGNEVSEKDGLDVLEVVESFLVRRAICGHEPTGLHAVFKRLWLDCQPKVHRESVVTAIKKHKTVVWPNNDEVRDAILSRPQYGSSITPYVLRQYNRSLGGDVPSIEPWIEHVLPDNPEESWFTIFTKEEHVEQKHLLANLLPLSKAMNLDLGNKSYQEKRSTYLDDSAFKATRQFAKEHEQWTPALLKKRSEELAEWAVRWWPHY